MSLSVHGQLVKPQPVPGVARMDVDGILSRNAQRRDITLRDTCHTGNMAKCVNGDLVEPRSARRVLRVDVGICPDGREHIRVRLVSCIVHQVVCTGWNGNAHAFLTVHRHFCAVQQHLLDDVLLKLFVVVQV